MVLLPTFTLPKKKSNRYQLLALAILVTGHLFQNVLIIVGIAALRVLLACAGANKPVLEYPRFISIPTLVSSEKAALPPYPT